MKKSEFISAVLNSPNNTVFTTTEQVKNAIEVFESFGMLPPASTQLRCVQNSQGVDEYYKVIEWAEE